MNYKNLKNWNSLIHTDKQEKGEKFITECQRLVGKYGVNGVRKSLFCNHRDKDGIRQKLSIDVKCMERFGQGCLHYLKSVSPMTAS